MVVNDLFDIEIHKDSKALDIDPESFSLTLHESIHSFYPTAKLNISDTTGLLKDSLFGVEGFKLSFAMNNLNFDKNPPVDFVVYLPEYEQNNNRIISGNQILDLVHDFYDIETIESKAYKDRISNIVKKEVSKYNFSSIDINDTGSNSTWYKLFSNTKDFIENVLLPNAYSDNSNETSFFVFINLKNEFHFNNYKSLSSSSTGITLEYKPDQDGYLSPNLIYKLEPFYTGSKKHKQLRSVDCYTRDKETGKYFIENLKLSSFPKNSKNTKKLPIIYDESITTNIINMQFSKEETGEKEALKARLFNIQKNGYFIERLKISTILNQNLTVGKTITINVYKYNNNSTSISTTQSGDFLIEDCIHHWDRLTKKAITECIVSRKFISIPPNSLLKDKLV